MKSSKKEKEYFVEFLMKSSSLHDLLEILANICKNLELKYLNPRIKHFRYFQFTFFGLMVKAKGLLEMMSFRAEFLKKTNKDFEDVHLKLIRLKKNMDKTYNTIHNDNMEKGRNDIIKIANEYSNIYDLITDSLKKHF